MKKVIVISVIIATVLVCLMIGVIHYFPVACHPSGSKIICSPNIGVMARNGNVLAYNNENSLWLEVGKKEAIRLSCDDAWNINVVRQGIFYENLSDGSRLYFIDFEGNKKALTDFMVTDVSVYGGWVYYINPSDVAKIYRMKLDGSESGPVGDDPAIYMNMHNGWAYYCNGNDNNHLYKLNVITGKKAKLAEHVARNIVLCGEWVYYINSYDIGAVYRVKDGCEPEKVLDGGVLAFNIFGEDLYFSRGDVYRADLEGKKAEKVMSGDAYEIIVDKDCLYFLIGYSNVLERYEPV